MAENASQGVKNKQAGLLLGIFAITFLLGEMQTARLTFPEQSRTAPSC
jgi:hypothetical protein